MTLKSVAEQANVTQGTVYSFSHKKEPDAGGGSSCVRQFMGKRKEQSVPPTEKLKLAKARTKENAYYHRLILMLTF
ncbi:hypothetical protein [Bacillus halotolerans]|uniref:hypothetical protein n=1 Tax=Bacillus halotolerans TaxID=260554 RepID=UPI002931A3F1|nr:hypothetical protein [Bacillus halotolerans]